MKRHKNTILIILNFVWLIIWMAALCLWIIESQTRILKLCTTTLVHILVLCARSILENINCILRFEKEENFISYEYDIKNLEFNFKHKVQQKSRRQYPSAHNSNVLIRMLFSFEKTNSHRVSFLNAVTEKGVSVYYPDFESLAIWTPAGERAPFLCLEPWNGSAIFHPGWWCFCSQAWHYCTGGRKRKQPITWRFPW